MPPEQSLLALLLQSLRRDYGDWDARSGSKLDKGDFQRVSFIKKALAG